MTVNTRVAALGQFVKDTPETCGGMYIIRTADPRREAVAATWEQDWRLRIVRAVNAHDEMLAALKLLLAGCPDETFQYGARLTKAQVEHLNGAILAAKDAVAKAEGR